jgi:hypothetical protein
LTILAAQYGNIVQDYSGPMSSVSGTGGLTVMYQNSRGLAPVNYFPLSPLAPIEVFVGLWTNEWEPVYEWRGVIPSCFDTTLSDVEHGPAYTLTYNHSFETIGLDAAGIPDAHLAAFWKGKNTFNDVRVCNAPRGGTSAYVGLCGIYMQSDAAAKSKFVNKYNGTIGKSGDTVLLNFYVQTLAGYTGGGKVIGKLYLADGSVLKLVLTTPAVPVSYDGYPYYTWADLSAPIVAAKTMIKQGYGTGVITLDAVTLSVFTSAGDLPRTVLLVPDGPASETPDNP